jgi:hypothetical protein
MKKEKTQGEKMTRYAEDKKMREDLIGKVASLCKTHNYELNEEELKRLKRMKFYDLAAFSSSLCTRISQRRNEMFPQALEKLNQQLAKYHEVIRARLNNQ